MKRSREGYVVERTLPLEIREMICETAETYADYMLCCYALCVFPRKGIHETRMRFAKWTSLPSSPGVRAFGIPSRDFAHYFHVPKMGMPLNIEKTRFASSPHMPSHDITTMQFCTSSSIASVTRNRYQHFDDHTMFITSRPLQSHFCFRVIELSTYSGTLVVRCRSRTEGVDEIICAVFMYIDPKPFLDTLWRELKAGQHTFNGLWAHVQELEDDPKVRAKLEMQIPESEN